MEEYVEQEISVTNILKNKSKITNANHSFDEERVETDHLMKTRMEETGVGDVSPAVKNVTVG
jgi:hypothetical protein